MGKMIDLKGKKLKEFLKCEPLTETKISNIRRYYGENRMKIPTTKQLSAMLKIPNPGNQD